MTFKEIETMLYTMTESEIGALKYSGQIKDYQRIAEKKECTEKERTFKQTFENSEGFWGVNLNRNGYADMAQMFEEQEGAFHIARQARYCVEHSHRHHFFEIFIVYSGQCRCAVKDESLLLHKGDICIISLDTYHQVQPLSAEDVVVCFRMKTDLINRMENTHPLFLQYFKPQLDGKPKLPYCLLHGEGRERLWTVFYLLISEYFQHDLLSFQSSVYSCHLFFNELCRLYSPAVDFEIQKQRKELSEDLLDYISHFYQTCTLESMSKQFGYSASYLSLYIKETTGLGFREHRKNFRLEEAARLLANETDSVVEIAKQVGYDSQNAFYEAFIKKFGMTPGEYRNKKKE